MKLLLIGRRASINHWLEDAAEAFRLAGHQVLVGAVRRPWLNASLEAAMAEPLAAALAARAKAFGPDLILAVGGFHVASPFLERLAGLAGRPPLVGWVGDTYGPEASPQAGLYDLVAYTDTALAARHAALGFASRALFLPHAAAFQGQYDRAAHEAADRDERMVFVGAATPGRRAVVTAITEPMVVQGPGWTAGGPGVHEARPGRLHRRRLAGVYARHLAVLNIRNEANVLAGLNQRSFAPYLSATPVLSDDQADLGLCFEPGSEVLVWRDTGELNATYERLRREPGQARRVGEAGRRRVIAEHTYLHRLARLRANL